MKRINKETIKVAIHDIDEYRYKLLMKYYAKKIVAKPKSAKQAIRAVRFVFLHSKAYHYGALRMAYDLLDKIVEVKPELSERIIETLTLGLHSKANYFETLRLFYDTYDRIYEARPELVERIIETLTLGLHSKQNDWESYEKAYVLLGKIVETRPEFAERVIDVIKLRLQSKEISKGEFDNAYKTLDRIIKAHPELAEQVFEAIKFGLQTGSSALNPHSYAYNIIVEGDRLHEKKRPDIVLPLLDTIQNDWLLSDNPLLLENSYCFLDFIAFKYPELAERVLKIIKIGLQSKKNNDAALSEAFKTLKDIAIDETHLLSGKMTELKPELAEQVIDVIKTAFMQTYDIREFDVSLFGTPSRNAFPILHEIIKNQPQLIKQVLEIVDIDLKANNKIRYSEEYYKESRLVAFSLLLATIKEQPQFNQQTAEIILSRIKNNEKNIVAFIGLANICTKKEIKEKLQAKYPNHAMMLEAAYKIRFSFNEEISFAVENMSYEQIAEMRKISEAQKCLNILVAELDKENGGDGSLGSNRKEFYNSKLFKDNANWLVPAAYAAAEIFECLPNYLNKTKSVGVSVHDAVYFLPFGINKDDSKSLGEFLLNKVIYVDEHGKRLVRPSSELGIIAKKWESLTPDQRKKTYKGLLSFCQSKNYIGHKYEGFAAEAAKAGISEKAYPELENFYEASLDVPCPFDVSKEFKFGNLVGRFVPRDDPRVGFFGNHTNCCQHFEGVGKACARSSMIDPWSQLFVVEKEDNKGNKRIVAGSWMWENEVTKDGKMHKYACADNIEAIGDYKSNSMINHIYENMAKYLCQECGYCKVTSGTGNQDVVIKKYPETEAIPLPDIYGMHYSDARSQVLLAENEQAPEVDNSVESLRFIRRVTRDDFEQMQKVADKCFPDGDEALQIPEEDFNGFVLVDKYKSVQGYILYDKQEKHIYDVAVMPRYRKDKNASSNKLLGEMIKECQKLGGEWSWEAIEPYVSVMKAMAERGLCELKIGDVDHEMSDGTKVYNVKFTPLDREKSKQKTPVSDKQR